jgi:hypothetical protein
LELRYELPDMHAEIGLGAVLLDPEHGYVFASFGYEDEEHYLHNDIIRFQTKPGTFSIEPTGSVRFTDVFKDFPSSRTHQIGHMAILDDVLYVSVGDALQSAAGRDVSSLLGKVLRMTLDGEPLPDNPFFTGSTPPKPRDYVWAYGLRNPFGLVAAEGELFAAENGPSVDRFIRVERGRSYGYDGTDWSMGIHALAVFAPSVGPAQAAWLPESSTIFPGQYAGAFYLTFGGSLQTIPGPGPRGERSVVYMPYDHARGMVLEPPRPLVRYRGDALQMPVGVAFGPDGLYVTPLFPVRDGNSGVLRVSYDPEREHPLRIARDESPAQLLTTYGCHGCHAAYENRTSMGPSLNPLALVARVQQRLLSDDYARQVLEIDALSEEPYSLYRDARREVMAAEGKDKVRLWIKYRILEPRFDSTTSMMPTQGISEAEADRLATYFVDAGWGKTELAPTEPEWLTRLKDALPLPRYPRYRYFVFPLAAGLAAGWWLGSRRRRAAGGR